MDVRECVSCLQDFPPLDLYQCPCSDEYCRECLTGLVHLSLRDETLFLPRCCRQPIPITSGSWFSRDLVLQLYAKQLEYETPNRTYCSVPKCSTFVPPAYIIGAIARCPTCSQLTCTNCKEEQHAGICRKNDTLQQLQRLANENGWQICRICHRIVELDRGCYHITCRCGAEFCYACGIPWKGYSCLLWDEARLLEVYPGIINGDLNEQECAHQSWQGRPGPRRCDLCGAEQLIFVPDQ